MIITYGVENDSSGVFSNVRAAYEFYSIKSQLNAGDFIINELMSNNLSVVTDPSTDFDDWIELYNPTNSPISTNGLFLTDTPNLLQVEISKLFNPIWWICNCCR